MHTNGERRMIPQILGICRSVNRFGGSIIWRYFGAEGVSGGGQMKKMFIAVLSTLLASVTMSAQEHEKDRMKHAGEVLQEILNIPDNLPKSVLDKSECVIVIPSVKKFAIGIGGNYGRGAMTCRGGASFTGPWGPPAMVALEGANIGFQLGGQATDFVLLVVNPKGIDSVAC